MWGEKLVSATIYNSLGALPGLQAAHFPIALVDAAGLAAHPVFTTAGTYIAREEILTREAVQIVGRSDGGHRAASAGLGVLPGLTRAFAALPEHLRRRRPGIGQVTLARLRLGGRGGGLARNRAGGLGARLFFAFLEQRVELIREAAA